MNSRKLGGSIICSIGRGLEAKPVDERILAAAREVRLHSAFDRALRFCFHDMSTSRSANTLPQFSAVSKHPRFTWLA